MVKVVRNACYGGFGLSNYAKLWMQTHGCEHPESLPRHHPLLVKCVETLGKEANGRSASLVVETINRQYYLEYDDGYEHLITPEDDPPNWIDGSTIEE